MVSLARLVDKTGVVGSVVAAMSCAGCFPALASIGTAIGLGVLSPWESLFYHILLPVFAIAVLLANGLSWFSHRIWYRSLLGMVGPILVLLGRYEFGNGVFYAGLAVMTIVAAWDLIQPARRKRAPEEVKATPGKL
ncbi:organomercurial transporter MerC [Asticcacaulis sp.]|uniref:organomercurial transporter MerC n=1 Tax=Asticcacaulis sp. TaxID=1872648 RepID=UPI0031D8A5B6